ncbi:hypothetical protein ACQ86N_48180 [Puia sp. P3]|uniref:hypothetical protein n=1 Tax=Puia sp. P3 TaxID=3423952 RepID=UPI003D67D6AE
MANRRLYRIRRGELEYRARRPAEAGDAIRPVQELYQFAFEKPNLAGHAFWVYLGEKYKKENVTYFLYLARVYRNLNNASMRICKKKFKEVLKDFMNEEEDKYEKDIRGRRNFPKGTVSVTEDINDRKDFVQLLPQPDAQEPDLCRRGIP